MSGDGVLPTLTILTAVGCVLVGGVFFAFSNFIMKALARLPAPNGIAAMQSINITVITPLFMAALFGTGAACVALVIWALRSWHAPGAAHLLMGGMLYIVGTVLVTIVFHVPRNNALAAVDPASTACAQLWAGYLRSWTAWNHVRTVAALAAAALLIMALRDTRGGATL